MKDIFFIILKSKPNIKNYKQQDQEEKGISIIEFEIDEFVKTC